MKQETQTAIGTLTLAIEMLLNHDKTTQRALTELTGSGAAGAYARPLTISRRKQRRPLRRHVYN